MSKVQQAINEGKIPHSVISAATKYCQNAQVASVKVADLYDYIQKAKLVELFGNLELSEERQVTAMLTALNDVGNVVEDEALALDVMLFNGWQVEVDVFKPSGKFAYSGIVSLGQAQAHDDLLPVILERQTFMTGLNPDHYNIAVNDTRVNDDDLNYTRCAKRLFATAS